MATHQFGSRRDLLRSVGAGAALPELERPGGSTETTPTVQWTARADGGSFLAPLATGHGAVYAATKRALVSLSTTTGRPNWTLEEGLTFLRPSDVRDSTVFVRTQRPTRLLAVDPADGGVRWQFPGVEDLVVEGGTVYAIGDRLAARSASDGTLQWAFETAGEPRRLVVGPSRVFVGTVRGTLHAVGRAEGTGRWRFDAADQVDGDVVEPVAVSRHPRTGGGSDREGEASAAARTVYVWDRTSYSMHAVAATDGRVRWTYSFEERTPVLFPGTFGADAVYLSDGERLVSVDLADGSENWRFRAESELDRFAPTRGTAGLVVGSDYDSVYAVSASDGGLRWRFRNRDTGSLYLAGVARDAVTATTTRPAPESVYRLDVADGSVRWRYECDCDLMTVIGDDGGATYAGTEDGQLYALADPGSGPLATAADAATRVGPLVLAAGLLAGGALLGARRLLRSRGEPTDATYDWGYDDFRLVERLSPTARTERHVALLPGRDDPVALVRLRPDARDDPDLVAAFESGIETAAGLDVDGVPEVVGSGTSPEQWLATEHPAGGTLADRAEDLGPGATLDAVATACEAVHAAHEGAVTHGRLSPECIGFRSDDPGSVAVTDWELRDFPLPDDDAYRAPEQVGGDGSATPELTDVYRLGAVAYWAVAGRPPRGRDPGAVDFETALRAPTELDPDLPSKLDVRLGRALAVDPADRFESAGSLADALRYGVPRD